MRSGSFWKTYPAVLSDLFVGLMLSAFLLYPGLRGYADIQAAKQSAFGTLNDGSWQFALIDDPAVTQWKLFTLDENYLPDGEEEIITIIK